MEIERKFKVISADLKKFEGVEIKQAYLSIQPEVRVRKMCDRAFITLKGDGDLIREEIESEIAVEIADALMKNISQQIEKTRYLMGRWEIDVYRRHLKGLVIAEIELHDPTEPLPEIPHGLMLGEEITSDAKYKNKNLALTQSIPE